MKTKFLLLISALFIVTCANDRLQQTEIIGEGLISTGTAHEGGAVFSLARDTLFFTRASSQFDSSTLYFSIAKNGNWQSPVIMPFSGKYYDAGIAFTPDRSRAFFTSKRPTNDSMISDEWNIWQISRQANSWLQPSMIQAPINSPQSDCCMTMNANGVAYFASERDGDWNIYRAEWQNDAFQHITKLDASINSDGDEWPSYISDDEATLVFSSIRTNGFGGDDLYLARKDENGLWQAPVLLDSTINTSSYEDSGSFSSDRKWFYFASWRDTDFSKGRSNIYRIQRSALFK